VQTRAPPPRSRTPERYAPPAALPERVTHRRGHTHSLEPSQQPQQRESGRGGSAHWNSLTLATMSIVTCPSTPD
jgi:hypothetical protein